MKSSCRQLVASAGFAAVLLAASPVSAQSIVPPPVCPTITLTPATLPNGTVGVAYSQTIVGNGGTAPYTFRELGRSLPLGLTLTPAGVLEGTPVTPGITSISIGATDADGCFGSAASRIGIAAEVAMIDARPRRPMAIRSVQ